MQMETLPSGTILHGRYRIERALGSGGFGHVYLSVDLQTNTQYAIKEYLVTGASGKAQLEHEAQVLSQLHHPNLPAFLSAFDERGHYYVVLGYIEGNDLTDYVRVVRQKNEIIPLARLMEWLLSICDAVSFLHSQRPPIIHRDIKPDNIRITPSGTAILVDLGNAKTAADGARTLFFIRHQGTPGYAPLEQYPGGTGTDERSDVYALGGTLYFALTAHEPPSVSARNQSLQQKQPDLPSLQDRLAQNPSEASQEQRQFRLGVSKPAKPAPRHSRHLAQLGTLSPELLRKLDAVIRRAMAMRPKERYQSVAEFSNDLKSILKALPASTAPATSKRPVDPHSTQPDLPMLYEAMQNAQTTPPAQIPNQDKSGQQPPATTSSSQAALRCPRCGTELPRPAPFCPRCGNPIQTPPPPNSPKGPTGNSRPPGQSNPPARDISDEATILIPPRISSPDVSENNQRPGQPPASRPGPASASASASATISRQQLLNTQSQPVPAVPTSQTPLRGPQTSTHNSIKPFIPVSPSVNTGQVQTTSSPMPSSAVPLSPPGRLEERRRKVILSLVIAIVTLILVSLIILVFLKSQHLLGLSNLPHSESLNTLLLSGKQ
ncbi:MAG TPA: protein kinase [Ktedonobacteraceae bacterium]|nr:protein kinase [Ktedonobacteraceae bacterium]